MDAGSGQELLLHIDNGQQRTKMTQDIADFPGLKVAWLIHPHSQYEICVEVGRQFDFLFSAVKSKIDSLTKHTGKIVFWLPLAVDPAKIYPDEAIEPQYVIGFVGRMQERAVPMITAAKRMNISYLVTEAWGDDYRRALCQSQIVFNQNYSCDLNFRTFEVMAAQRLLLTNWVSGNGLHDLFTPGYHHLEWLPGTAGQDIESAIELVRDDPDVAARMSERGYHLATEKHTFKHRMIEILRKVSEWV